MKLHIVYCGGTLGMVETAKGFTPTDNFKALWLKYFQPSNALHEVYIYQVNPVIDSANLQPTDWNKIVRILDSIEEDANVLVIHGTDTLSWTAAYLYLANRRHRMVITGSQRPTSVEKSDAFSNVEGAIRSFKELETGQTVIYFGHRLIDAQNSIKFSSVDDAAFINFLAPRSKQDPLLALSISPVRNDAVSIVHLFPGIKVPESIDSPFIILEAYGAGNGPDADSEFMEWLNNSINQGRVVGITSSCVHGGTYDANYSSGNALIEAGAVLLEGFTTSAAFARGHFLAPKNIPAQAKAAFWRSRQQ